MMLAVWRPTAIAGVILNDIGPVIEPRGLVRIKQYVGKLPVPRTLEEGAEILRWWFNAQFHKLAPQDWIAFAQRTWREHRGALMPNHDLRLARALRGVSLERLPTFWDQFDALAHIPLCYGQPPGRSETNSDVSLEPSLFGPQIAQTMPHLRQCDAIATGRYMPIHL